MLGAAMVTDAQEKLVQNPSPELRGDFARDNVRACRTIVLKQIAAASRAHNTEALTLLETLKNRLDKDFDLVIAGDEGAMKRALGEHAEFLMKHKEQQTPKGITGGLDGGPG
jgi:hypothetical protein